VITAAKNTRAPMTDPAMAAIDVFFGSSVAELVDEVDGEMGAFVDDVGLRAVDEGD